MKYTWNIPIFVAWGKDNVATQSWVNSTVIQGGITSETANAAYDTQRFEGLHGDIAAYI